MGDFLTIRIWALNYVAYNNLDRLPRELSFLHPHMREFTLVLND